MAILVEAIRYSGVAVMALSGALIVLAAGHSIATGTAWWKLFGKKKQFERSRQPYRYWMSVSLSVAGLLIRSVGMGILISPQGPLIWWALFGLMIQGGVAGVLLALNWLNRARRVAAGTD